MTLLQSNSQTNVDVQDIARATPLPPPPLLDIASASPSQTTVAQDIARATLEGHQRAIMGAMTVDEIFKDRKKFSEQVFDVASTDLVNMGIQVYHC